MITLGKTKSVCPICMKVLTAKKCIGEDGIYLVKECDIHGKFQTLIWEGTAAEYLSWGRENLSAETPVNPKIKEKSCPDNCGLCEEHERKRMLYDTGSDKALQYALPGMLCFGRRMSGKR